MINNIIPFCRHITAKDYHNCWTDRRISIPVPHLGMPDSCILCHIQTLSPEEEK